MTEQVEMVYDYMIRNGKKLNGRKLVRIDKTVYADTNLAEAYQTLIQTRGRLALFCNTLIKKGLYTTHKSARCSLFHYATQPASTRTIEKRIAIRTIYDSLDFKAKKVITKDMNKWNEKLNEYWRTQWQ